MRKYQMRALALDSTIIVSTSVGLEVSRLALDETYVQPGYILLQHLIIFAVWLCSMILGGAYNLRNLGSGIQEFKVVTRASFQGFLLLCVLALAVNVHLPRINLFAGWFSSLVLVTLGRKYLQTRLYADRKNGMSMRNTFILGSAEYAAEFTKVLHSNTQYGLRVVGSMPFNNGNDLVRSDVWLATIDQGIKDGNVEVIILEDSQNRQGELFSDLSWHLNQHEIDMLIVPRFVHQFGPRLEFQQHGQLPLVFIDEPTLSMGHLFLKRTFDLVFSLIALVVLSPILILTSLAILINDFGPVFFIQERIGVNGELFKILKFRSMIMNAHTMQDSVWQAAQEDGTNNKAKDDPRITSVGRFIRKYSIDELPQLINVLKGDMSIVGPRPIQQVELDMLQNSDLRRHLIKPALTGLWQISGRSDTTWEERIQLDLEYLHNWSLGLDIGIILKTVKVVATGEGAY
jgi:exopolysaccharide biosynthesis polyprenyl glycosylphosphotransferase